MLVCVLCTYIHESCLCVCCIKNARSIKGVHWTCVRVAPGCSTFLTISTVHNVWNIRWYNMYVRGCIYSTRLRYQSRADQRGVNIVYKHTTSYRVFLRLKNRRETPFAIFPFFVHPCTCTNNKMRKYFHGERENHSNTRFSLLLFVVYKRDRKSWERLTNTLKLNLRAILPPWMNARVK